MFGVFIEPKFPAALLQPSKTTIFITTITTISTNLMNPQSVVCPLPQNSTWRSDGAALAHRWII